MYVKSGPLIDKRFFYVMGQFHNMRNVRYELLFNHLFFRGGQKNGKKIIYFRIRYRRTSR